MFQHGIHHQTRAHTTSDVKHTSQFPRHKLIIDPMSGKITQFKHTRYCLTCQ